jgi:hypothetical protein
MKKNVGKSAFRMRFVLFFGVFLISAFTSFAQKNEVDVRAITTSNYPEVKGKLWVRNPEGIKTDGIQFYENDQPVKVNFESFQKVDSVAQNKAILFLIRNTANKAEMQWYKDVLSASFKNGTIKSGDKVEIVGFSCLLDKQILFPSKLNFTDNVQDLLARIDKIQENKRIEYDGRVQTHIAINEALNLLEAQNLNLPAGLFILSDDRSMPPLLTGELPGARSRRFNIPIYGVTYFKKSNYYDIEELCSQAYGRYITEATNDINIVSKELNGFLNEFENRHAGLYYPFTYTSTFEKDGKNHTVKIDSKKDGQSGFNLLVPSKNILELIQDNPLISGIIFVLFIGLIVVIVMMYKKNKLKKEELEIQRKKEFSEMEQHQRAAEQKLSQQEMELQRMKEEERKEAANALSEKQAQAQAQEDEVQLQKMLERGNFPWFEFRFGNETGSYQIQTPRLSVGRDESNFWTINHPTVSRNHFQLHFKNYVYTIRDLGSSNGLFVNDMKVTEIDLKHGDCIQVGEITLTFHI